MTDLADCLDNFGAEESQGRVEEEVSCRTSRREEREIEIQRGHLKSQIRHWGSLHTTARHGMQMAPKLSLKVSRKDWTDRSIKRVHWDSHCMVRGIPDISGVGRLFGGK